MPVSSRIARLRGFFSRHRFLRAAVVAVLVLLAVFFSLRPRGTKSFLVIGMDNYGSLNEIGRNDVNLLVHVDFDRSVIRLVTFARDMGVPTDSGRLRKLNTVVRSDGENGLASCIGETFGIPIDGWFRLNFTTVIELVDAIGGVPVVLEAKEPAYIDRQVGVYPDSPLAEGTCRLNGAQALAYARCRKLDNDLGRGRRQSKLLEGLLTQVRHLTPMRILSVFKSLRHAWRSSYSTGEQLSLLPYALWLPGFSLEKISLPVEGTWRHGEISSASAVIADLEANAEHLQRILSLPSSALPVSP